MAPTQTQPQLKSLDLPAEFEDLDGLLRADLRAIVNVLSGRANERLLLTRREHRQLQKTLWDRLAAAVNDSLAPLSADNR